MSDFYQMSAKMKELFPSNPEADKKALMAMVNAPQESVPETTNYVQESVEVLEGSLQIDKEYSVSDFAALAGVQLNETQKTGSAGQAKGSDPMPKAQPGRTKHPLKDKLVGEDDDLRRGVSVLNLGDDSASLVTAGLINAINGELLPEAQREALKPYVGLFVTIMKNPKLLSRLNTMKNIANRQEKDVEEKAPPGREDQVKKLKKEFDDPGAPYAIAWAQHNKSGKPKKESTIKEQLLKALNSYK